MSRAVLERLMGERDEARSAALQMIEANPDFDPKDETLVGLQTRATELDGRVASLAEILDAQQAADALDGKLAGAARRHQERSSEPQPQTRESWGAAFIRSEAFTEYRGRGQSARLDLDGIQTRALPTGIADLVAAGIKGPITSVDITPPPTPTPLSGAVNGVTVSGNAIEYVKWAKIAGGAAKVAEKAAKPSVEFGPTVTPDTLDLIAAYTQLTRQLMEDAPAVASMINGALQREVALKVESEAAAALAAATLPAVNAVDLLSAIRVGMGTVMAAGYSPNAVLLNPADWATLDLSVWAGTAAGPTVGQSFWGLTPISSTAQPAGTATVGDFKSGVTRFSRSGISVFVTDSHADTFLSNVFTILAEVRAKTVVVRPQALVECTKTP